MTKKNKGVFFLAVATLLFSVAFVSSTCCMNNTYSGDDIADITSIEVDGLYALNNDVSVIAGDTASFSVYFTAAQYASDVRIEVELEGDDVDVDSKTSRFDIECGYKYQKRLTMKIPQELEDEVSSNFNVEVTIWNGDYKTTQEFTLLIQRPTYSADVMAITADQSVDAGDALPVDVVIKNNGYNKLDDVYVKLSIPGLGLEKTVYYGDIVARECYDEEGYCDEDDEDYSEKHFYLNIPYDAKSGSYELVAQVLNDDLDMEESVQVVVNNEFSESNVIVEASSKSFATNKDAEYFITIANPTDKLKVYKVVAESTTGLSTTVDTSVVAVPAGSSKTVKITANAESQGDYDFKVNIYSGDTLISTTALNANVSGSSFTTSSTALITIILAIIFLVLLVILIVLLGKKPEKQEEFGESYY